MDFELDDDQAALQDATRRLCAARFDPATIRAIEHQPGAVDRARWAELADAGVFSLRLPEEDGGAGRGMADAALVFEELGRACVPGPLVATHLAAGIAVETTDGGDGPVVVGLVDHREPAAAVVVDHLDALDALFVLGGDGVRRVDRSQLDRLRLDATAITRPLDPLTPVHRVARLPEGERVGDADLATRWRAEGACLTAALLLGLAETTVDLAVAYAKEREQFDRPIGSFQAVKHILADMLVRAEVARAAVYAAAVTCDQPEVGDAGRLVAGAKLLAAEAAVANGKACVQVHGGMGFTWEVDAHLYLKRAWVLETAFGAVDEQAEAVAALL